MSKGLGRIPEWDERNRLFSARTASPRPALLTGNRYWWDLGWWGDQGSTSMCVAFSSAHFLEDSPVTHPDPGPWKDPKYLYDGARRYDEWPGEAYEGTSGLGACRFMKAEGIIAGYDHCFTPDDVVNALLIISPVLLGIPWYESQDDEDFLKKNGYIRVDTGSGLRGYHEVVANGVNTSTGLLRIKNSWGRGWGLDGRFRMRISDLDATWKLGETDAMIPRSEAR
jgi:hypothetical protein